MKYKRRFKEKEIIKTPIQLADEYGADSRSRGQRLLSGMPPKDLANYLFKSKYYKLYWSDEIGSGPVSYRFDFKKGEGGVLITTDDRVTYDNKNKLKTIFILN